MANKLECLSLTNLFSLSFTSVKNKLECLALPVNFFGRATETFLAYGRSYGCCPIALGSLASQCHSCCREHFCQKNLANVTTPLPTILSPHSVTLNHGAMGICRIHLGSGHLGRI
jgi:hypothetical protein